jgi:thymidylate synthase (FAD)
VSSVNLKWATPDGDALLANIARVSNPANQDNPSIEGLIQYMLRNGHVSPFEMVNACVEINTTREVGRQILRHRSFSFQEFSQRYASVDALTDSTEVHYSRVRLQDTKNRQNSLDTTNEQLQQDWLDLQMNVREGALHDYRLALSWGVAKELARKLLPEGLTPTRMYMNGTLRSWIHYLQQRLHPSTQLEHRVVAEQIRDVLMVEFPVTLGAALEAT